MRYIGCFILDRVCLRVETAHNPSIVGIAGHPTRNVHLLSTLVLNSLRVETSTESGAVIACPLAPLFATQQVSSYLKN